MTQGQRGPFSWTATILGVPITIEPWFLVVAIVLGSLGGRTGPALLAWLVVATTSVLAHEAGHAAAFRAFGARPRIVLSSLFGLTYGDRLPFGRSIVVSLAGPLTGIAIGGLALAISPLLGGDALTRLVLGDVVWVNLGWGLLNLLPILPLDGGSVAAAILDRVGRPHRDALILSIVTAGLVVAGSLAAGVPYAALLIGWLAASNYEDLRALGDEWLRDRVDAHGRALLEGDVNAAIVGLEEAERAARSRAVRGSANAGLAFTLLAADRWEEAEGVLRRHPDPPSERLLWRSIDARRGRLDSELLVDLAESRYYVAAMGAARAILAGGQVDEFVRHALELPRRTGNRALLRLQIGLHYIREYVAAIRVGEIVHERQNEWEFVPVFLALDHAALDQVDEAIRWLNIAADGGFATLDELDDPRLDILRPLPAFAAVRARIADAESAATGADADVPRAAETASTVRGRGLPGIRRPPQGRRRPS